MESASKQEHSGGLHASAPRPQAAATPSILVPHFTTYPPHRGRTSSSPFPLSDHGQEKRPTIPPAQQMKAPRDGSGIKSTGGSSGAKRSVGRKSGTSVGRKRRPPYWRRELKVVRHAPDPRGESVPRVYLSSPTSDRPRRSIEPSGLPFRDINNACSFLCSIGLAFSLVACSDPEFTRDPTIQTVKYYFAWASVWFVTSLMISLAISILLTTRQVLMLTNYRVFGMVVPWHHRGAIITLGVLVVLSYWLIFIAYVFVGFAFLLGINRTVGEAFLAVIFCAIPVILVLSAITICWLFHWLDAVKTWKREDREKRRVRGSAGRAKA